jgi:hypothetical protein
MITAEQRTSFEDAHVARAATLAVRAPNSVCWFCCFFYRGSVMWITIRSLMFVIGKGIGAIGLGCLILWQVVVHIGPQHGVAYVHVSTPNVDVTVDDVVYRVDTLWGNPRCVRVKPWHPPATHDAEQNSPVSGGI